MQVPRISIAGLSLLVAFFAMASAGLVGATDLWYRTVWSVALAALAIAPLGVIYRKGEARASWVGFALCGWLYLALSSGPWLGPTFKSRLITTSLIDTVHQRAAPRISQPSSLGSGTHLVNIEGPVLEGLGPDELRAARVAVWSKPMMENDRVLTLQDAEVVDASFAVGTAFRVTLLVDDTSYPKVKDALLRRAQFYLVRRKAVPPSSVSQAAVLDPHAYQDRGHALISLACGLLGGYAGRFFYLTRDHETVRSRDTRRE